MNGCKRSDRIYRIVSSVPILMVLLLALLEILLRQGNPVDAMDLRSVDAWGAVPRLELVRRLCPQIVLLGSSVVMVLNQDENGKNGFTRSQPAYFCSLLAKVTGKDISCVNLATGAQMVSEAYFMTEAICSARPYPPVILYGVGLRDFSHEALREEWRTESFNSIAPYVPLAAINDLPSLVSVREFILCHCFYLYRDRGDFKNMFAVLVKQALENLPVSLDCPFSRMGLDYVWHQSRSGLLKEQLVPRVQERFFDRVRLDHPEFLNYSARRLQKSFYKTTNTDTAELSQHYFRCLQNLCKRKKIDLVLVTMPLAPETAEVVPAQSMQAFRNYLLKGSTLGDFKFIDLWADPRFVASDYGDGVHFNASGTRKFADIVVGELQTKYPEVLDVMRRAEGAQ